MPLALLAGMSLPECECANGQHRFFCRGALGIAARVQTTPMTSGHDCCPASKCCVTAVKCCCCGDSSSGTPGPKEPCGGCKSVPRSVLTVGEILRIPELGSTVFFLCAFMSLPSVESIVPNWAMFPERIETGPPLDRVIVFRCLLI